ncbi:MAG: hypothetical protein PHC56_08850 [Herbinix sp.]|nr:hypothetical protein [Herbinix sp.]
MERNKSILHLIVVLLGNLIIFSVTIARAMEYDALTTMISNNKANNVAPGGTITFNTEENTIVSGGAITFNTEEDGVVTGGAIKIENNDNPVYSVILPTSCDIIVDPFEIAGMGQIYSEQYEVINLSDIDIIVELKSVDIKISGENNNNKTCSIYMDTIGPDINIKNYLLNGYNDNSHLKFILFSPYGEKQIKDKNTFYFNLKGKLSHNSELLWKNSDIKLSFVFDFHKH